MERENKAKVKMIESKFPSWSVGSLAGAWLHTNCGEDTTLLHSKAAVEFALAEIHTLATINDDQQL